MIFESFPWKQDLRRRKNLIIKYNTAEHFKNKYPPAKPGVFHRRAKPYDTSHASRHVGAA